MRRRVVVLCIAVSAIVFAVSVAVPAFGGPSASKTTASIKRALGLAKSADKRARRAERLANQALRRRSSSSSAVQGPEGPAGPAGPAGPQGPAGPAGAAGGGGGAGGVVTAFASNEPGTNGLTNTDEPVLFLSGGNRFSGPLKLTVRSRLMIDATLRLRATAGGGAVTCDPRIGKVGENFATVTGGTTIGVPAGGQTALPIDASTERDPGDYEIRIVCSTGVAGIEYVRGDLNVVAVAL